MRLAKNTFYKFSPPPNKIKRIIYENFCEAEVMFSYRFMQMWMEAGEKLKQNQNKQAKLTDAYLENILGEDVFRGKMEKLREKESKLQNILASIELAAIEKEHSAGYKNRVKDFLEGYDDELSEVDVSTKRAMCGLLFKNIKIAPPIGRAAASKRISFSLFEPFNSLFSEGENLKKCPKNQNKIQIQKCESSSSHLVVK